jgi:uncharacterized protein YkwD
MKNMVICLLLCIITINYVYSQARIKPRTKKSTTTTCPYAKQQSQKNSCPTSRATNVKNISCFASQDTDLSTQSLFDEVNYARTTPKEYAKVLEQRLNSYSGSEKTDCKEAIAFLKKQPNRSAYIFSRALGQAAFDHCKDMNDKKFFDHTGSDGSSPSQRISKYGHCSTWAENISAGTTTSRDAVVAWIIDSGVASRGHRKSIFSDNYVYLGIAWCIHPSWRATQTADFASANFSSNMKDDNVIFEFISNGE